MGQCPEAIFAASLAPRLGMFAQSVYPKDQVHNLIKGDLGSMQGCQVKEIRL
jgi:hypothetical protein